MKLLSKTPREMDSLLPEISIPENWNRLSGKQLLFLASLFQKQLAAEHFKIAALNYLGRIKIMNQYFVDEDDFYHFLVKHKRHKFFITAGLYAELIKRVSFVAEVPTLTSQLIKRFLLGRWYFGPCEACYNLTYNELIHAELAWSNFNNTKEVIYLEQLVAILYRPKKKNLSETDPEWEGDFREKFSAYTYERRARWFRFLPFKIKYAIYIFFTGSLHHMMDQHPLCFKSSTKITSNPKKQNPAKALIDLVPVITKGDPTKNNDLYRSPAWDVFDAYERMCEENQLMKAK